jgi:3-oxoacyl-(acyl-carrier-protein) synthase
MDVVVTGIGLVSALGTLETSWKRLLSGESGIERDQPFLELERRPLALIGAKPADLITLIRQVLADALQDANLILPVADCGIAIGSSRGFQANLEQLASVGIRHSEEERGKKEEERGKKKEGRALPITRLPITDYRFSIREFFASHGGDGGGEGYWLDGAGAGADGCLCDGYLVDRPCC